MNTNKAGVFQNSLLSCALDESSLGIGRLDTISYVIFVYVETKVVHIWPTIVTVCGLIFDS